MKTAGSTTPATRGRAAAKPRAAPAPSASASARAKIEAAAPPLRGGVAKPHKLTIALRPNAPPVRPPSGATIAASARRSAAAFFTSTAAGAPALARARSEGVPTSSALTATSSRITELEAELEKVSSELAAQADDNASLTRAVEESNLVAAAATESAAQISKAATEQVAAFEAHIAAQQAALAAQAAHADAELTEQARVLGVLGASLGAQTALVAELRLQLLAGEAVRRDLHNQLHELKGNIRVVCRLRPQQLKAGADAPAAQSQSIYRTFDQERALELASVATGAPSMLGLKASNAQAEVAGPPAGARWAFAFDRVLDAETTQAQVFDEVAPLCQSALDGYKVAIFAYGQTGSGKTHTMLGDVTAAPAAQPRAGAKRRASGGCAGGEAGGAALGEGAGVIPRALALLFRKAAEAKAGGWSFEFEASLVEVYNEELRDLLPAGGAKEALPKLELRHERSGEVSVPNLTVHAVASEADAQGLLARAAGARATAKTGCNEHSSRSHSVFILRVAGEHADGGAVRGCLTLVDLAGSERVKDSGVTGARLKEAQAINKSLSALGDVIGALATKEKHIPYRNSKLTALMQPSLGGNAKTLMVVNVASEPVSWSESLCSLRFAQKVSGVTSGTVTRSGPAAAK